MTICISDNITTKLIDALKPALTRAVEMRVGIAFAKDSGLSLIKDYVGACLEKGGSADFVLGLDFRTTEPKVLRYLHGLKERERGLSFCCFSDPSAGETPTYHPKIYLIRTDNRHVISIGSSNLTRGGLRDNVEINAVIEANDDDEIVSDVYGVYNRLKIQGRKFIPNVPYIDKYEELYENLRKKRAATLKDKRVKEKIEALVGKEKSLPPPKISEQALFGWQRLVYDRLPDGIFKTSDMYKYEEELREFYPENRHITDKIRQILQQLRDLGFLRHVGTSRWRKT